MLLARCCHGHGGCCRLERECLPVDMLDKFNNCTTTATTEFVSTYVGKELFLARYEIYPPRHCDADVAATAACDLCMGGGGVLGGQFNKTHAHSLGIIRITS